MGDFRWEWPVTLFRDERQGIIQLSWDEGGISDLKPFVFVLCSTMTNFMQVIGHNAFHGSSERLRKLEEIRKDHTDKLILQAKKLAEKKKLFLVTDSV